MKICTFTLSASASTRNLFSDSKGLRFKNSKRLQMARTVLRRVKRAQMEAVRVAVDRTRQIITIQIKIIVEMGHLMVEEAMFKAKKRYRRIRARLTSNSSRWPFLSKTQDWVKVHKSKECFSISRIKTKNSSSSRLKL